MRSCGGVPNKALFECISLHLFSHSQYVFGRWWETREPRRNQHEYKKSTQTVTWAQTLEPWHSNATNCTTCHHCHIIYLLSIIAVLSNRNSYLFLFLLQHGTAGKLGFDWSPGLAALFSTSTVVPSGRNRFFSFVACTEFLGMQSFLSQAFANLFAACKNAS